MQKLRTIVRPCHEQVKCILGIVTQHYEQRIVFKSSFTYEETSTCTESLSSAGSRKSSSRIQPDDLKRGKYVAHEPTLTEKLSSDEHPTLCRKLIYDRFVVYYNHQTKTPSWVYEYLTPVELESARAQRKKSRFEEDQSIDPVSRATKDDYKCSGFVRGHMAAAGNHKYCQSAMDQTFLLSNILPQVGPGFDGDIWRHLEEGVRDIALLSNCVHMYTGPLYIPQKSECGKTYTKFAVIGKNRVAVPTHLFKTMLVVSYPQENHCRHFLMSIILPNQSLRETDRIEDYLVTRDDIEIYSGMRFFKFLERSKIFHQEILGDMDDCAGYINAFKARQNLGDSRGVINRYRHRARS